MPRIGTVTLRVKDLDRQLEFYQNILGMQIHRQEDDLTYLGTGDTDLLILKHTPNNIRRKGHNGLFHIAYLLPNRKELARFVYHLANKDVRLGMGDHSVSEAIYLDDVEGNGIEIYADRPRNAWERQNGQIAMSSTAIDVDNLMQELNGEQPSDVLSLIHI